MDEIAGAQTSRVWDVLFHRGETTGQLLREVVLGALGVPPPVDETSPRVPIIRNRGHGARNGCVCGLERDRNLLLCMRIGA